ncbi:hypothetical protein FB567DRAFT_550139 [Paraphoma chrysanthemicola]|uniref:Uncharacterized protein n=1 Tax=Paraphoma chrysanthemicola TaxID=798071 RepID=A0A8K0R2S5_9PLEO|nr:hypothetical protein FB567DRAFT_550139 [Paraphoma chrysanthemicola]
MDSIPADSIPTSSGTKFASYSPICVFEDHPRSTIDIVVISSQSTIYPKHREQQQECCERLKAAKPPARILTFTYDAREFESWRGSEGAALLYPFLSLEREASGRTTTRIIFISAHRNEDWVIPILLADSFAVGLESPVEGLDVSSVYAAPIVRSTIGILHFPPSQYTYRQRILEMAILAFLQWVGIVVLHCSDRTTGCSIGSFQSPLFFIGYIIDASLSNRPFSHIITFWAGLEIMFWVFQDSLDVWIIESALRYAILAFFPFCYANLAMLQFNVNRHDQLQWLFLGVSIVAVITQRWLSAAEAFASLKTFYVTLPLAVTASMVCSACLHCLWRFFSGTGQLERKVSLLADRATTMVPGNLPPFLDFEDIIVENESFVTSFFGSSLLHKMFTTQA